MSTFLNMPARRPAPPYGTGNLRGDEPFPRAAHQELGNGQLRRKESAGITSYESDLAELIVQLAHDKPSHILVPAIHRNRDEIRQIFLDRVPGVDPELDNLPAHLAAAACAYLRRKNMPE
ncbi:hypothetical protein AMK21_09050 [Streptomyces sp. CB00316]|nr:hypothetical protein AMK21_09050 [Streptomyces sp. CB00316]